MNDATLIVLAMKRPDYFRRCLDAWGRARGSRSLRSVIVRLGRTSAALEAQMRQIAEQAAAEHGLPVTVVLDDPEDASHTGPDRALGVSIQQAFADPGCGFVIECDEDIVVSSDVLEYMAFARQLDVVCVCAHNDLGQGWSPRWDDTGADQRLVRVRGEFTSWCFGFSREAWTEVWEPEWDWDRTSGDHPAEHGWEWQMHRQCRRDTLRVAIPDASRCQDIGQHGGTFSRPEGFWATQAASYRAHRDPVDYVAVDETGTGVAGQ